MKRAIPVFVISAALGAAGGAGFKSLTEKSKPTSLANPVKPSANDPDSGSPARPASPAQETSKVNRPAGPRPVTEDLRAAPEADRLRLLIRWLPEASPAEIASLATEWFPEKSYNGSGNEVWQVLVQRWVEVDAAAALDYARKISVNMASHFSRGTNVMTPLHYAYRALGRHNPELAFAFLANETGPAVKFLISEVQKVAGADKTREWALSLPDRVDLADFQKAAARSNTGPDYSDPAKAIGGMTPDELKQQGRWLAGEWAKKDPTAALAWANGLESGHLRTDALTVIAKEMMARDPAAGLKVMESMPPTAARSSLGVEYVASLAKSDPAAALHFVEANLKGVPKLQAIAALAAAKAATDPAAALRMLRDHGIGDLNRSNLLKTIVDSPGMSSSGYSMSTDYASQVLRAAAVKDPEGVMDLLRKTGSIYPDNDADDPFSAAGAMDEGGLAKKLFKEWLTKDPAAAARWTASQPSTEAVQDMSKSALTSWFAQDQAAVSAFGASLPDSPGKTEIIRTTASLIAGSDPAGALTWTAQAGGPAVLDPVFQTIARTNPEWAATQFSSLPAEVQSARMQELTDNLGKRAPAAAVGFYQSLTETQQASVKLYDTTLSFARQDSKAASEWVTTLPPTYAKDTAISGLVDYLIKQSSDPDPEAAAYWAATSVDPAGRDRRLKRVGEAWFKRDPAGAAAAIGAAALPDDAKLTLLNYAAPK